MFAEDATYLIFLGEALIGRAAIESNHADVFAKWQKDTKLRVKALAIRALGPDVCSVLTVGGIGRQEPIAFDKLQTFTLVRDSKDLVCAAFQNTQISARALEANDFA